MNGSSACFEKNDWVTWKRIEADRSVMLDLNSGRYYTLNETATAIWELLSSGLSLVQGAGQLARLYQVDESAATKDIQELAGFFTEKGFLRGAQPQEIPELKETTPPPESKPYAKPSVDEHEAVQEIAAAGTGGYSGYGGGSHYWYPN